MTAQATLKADQTAYTTEAALIQSSVKQMQAVIDAAVAEKVSTNLLVTKVPGHPLVAGTPDHILTRVCTAELAQKAAVAFYAKVQAECH